MEKLDLARLDGLCFSSFETLAQVGVNLKRRRFECGFGRRMKRHTCGMSSMDVYTSSVAMSRTRLKGAGVVVVSGHVQRPWFGSRTCA